MGSSPARSFRSDHAENGSIWLLPLNDGAGDCPNRPFASLACQCQIRSWVGFVGFRVGRMGLSLLPSPGHGDGHLKAAGRMPAEQEAHANSSTPITEEADSGTLSSGSRAEPQGDQAVGPVPQPRPKRPCLVAGGNSKWPPSPRSKTRRSPRQRRLRWKPIAKAATELADHPRRR